KSAIHLLTKYQLKNAPKGNAINTSQTNSCDRLNQRLLIEAPNTLRIPISLRRCSAEKEANPNNPRQEIMIARQVKPIAIFPSIFSVRNLFANFSSTNLYSNGEAGVSGV